MAVRFDTSGEHYTATLTAGAQTAYTFCAWVKISVDTNTWATSLDLHSGSASNSATFETGSDGTTWECLFDNGNDQGMITATVGDWYFLAASVNGTTVNTYVKPLGGSITNSSSATISASAVDAAELLIGDWPGGGQQLNGCVTGVKLWLGAALSQAELNTESTQLLPVRTTNLTAAYPLEVAETTDYSGNGYTLTTSGTPSTEAGPAGIPLGGDPPGSVFTLTNWKLTLPTDGGDGGTTADEITQPQLDTYSDANFSLDASNQMVMVAPVNGATTSGSGSTRCELREMVDGGTVEAAWTPFDTEARRLTVTGTFDPTNITGGTTPRHEMIAGQIHGTLGSPPLYLAAEYHVATPRVRIYKYDGNGSPGFGNMLEGITASTVITYRIEYDPGEDPPAGTGFIHVYGAFGGVENLPATPQFSFGVLDFFDQTSGWYFKAGSYNKTTVASGSSGSAVATITYLELVQGSTTTIYVKSGGGAAVGAGSGAKTITPPAAHAKTGGAAAVGAGSGARVVDSPTTYDKTGGAAALGAGAGARQYVRSKAGGAAAVGAGSGARSLVHAKTGGAAAVGAGSGVRSMERPRTGGAAAVGAGSGAAAVVSVTIHDKTGGAAAVGAGAGAREYVRSKAGGAAAVGAGAGTQVVSAATVYVKAGGAAAVGAGIGHAAIGAPIEHSKTGGAAGIGAGSGTSEVQQAAVHDRTGGAAAVGAGAGARQYVRSYTGGAAASGAGTGAAELVPPAVHTRAGGAAAIGAGFGAVAVAAAGGYDRSGGAAARGAGSGAAVLVPPTVYEKTGGAAATGAGIALKQVIPPAVYVRSGGAAAIGAGIGRARVGGAFHAGLPYLVGAQHAGTPVAVGQLHAGPETTT